MDDLAHEAINKIPRFYKKKVKLSTTSDTVNQVRAFVGRRHVGSETREIFD